MKTAVRLFPYLMVVSVLLNGALVFAQDWPQWRGPNRDGKVSGFTAPQEWPKELKTVWQKNVGLGDASPSLSDGKLYLFTRQGEEEVLTCLDAASGDQLWQDKYPAPAVKGPVSSHPGPRSTPTVLEGKVVTLGVGGDLSCLDAATGKVLWRKNDYPDAVPSFYTAMSPFIINGLCIAHLGGKDKGAILAYDLNTGDVKWKWEGEGPAYASPVMLDVDGVKQLVIQTEKSLLGIATQDGKVLWQVATPVQGRATNSATPIVDGQTMIYTGQGNGTRAVKIAKEGEIFTANPLWTNEELGTDFNTPVLKDGLLYGLNSRGNIFCINVQTGKSAWTNDKRLDRFGTLLDAGEVLFALSSKSELIAFKSDETQYQEVAVIKVSDTPIYAHPIIAGNRIYMKDQDNITLLAME